MLEYRDFSDRICNDEAVFGERFHFTPFNSGLEGVAEEVGEQVAMEVSTDEWDIEASESDFGFGDMKPSAPVMGKSSTAHSSKAVTLIHGTKVIDAVTDGVEKYNLEYPVRGD